MNRRPPKPLTMPELEKAKALYAIGKSYHAIGLELKRDSKTIKKWLSEPKTAKEIQIIKGELSEMFEGMAKKMLESITEEDIQRINAYQRTVSAGISTDKMRLLKGESTQNLSLHTEIQEATNRIKQLQEMLEEGQYD